MDNREIQMAQKWAKNFYKSHKWIKCRNSYIQKRVNIDGGICEECHKNPGYIVHHKVILTQENITNADISLNHENLKYVCKECHDQFEGHGLNKGEKPLCLFDADGQPVSLREIDLRKGQRVPP
jgi:hypothetical protein